MNGLGRAGDRWVLARLVHAVKQGRAGCEMAAGRAAVGDDLLRIDAQLRRMRPHVAHRGSAVLDALEHRRAGVGLDQPVFDTDANQAELGEVRGKRILTARRQTSPAPAVDREETGPTIRGPVPFRLEDVQVQLAIADLLVHHHPRRFEFRGELADVVE
jgi:hypothetical protein